MRQPAELLTFHRFLPGTRFQLSSCYEQRTMSYEFANQQLFNPQSDTQRSAEPVSEIRNPQYPTPPYSKGLTRTDNNANSPTARCSHINIEILKIGETRCVARLLSMSDSAFFIDEPDKNRYYRLIKRMWRNWQTRRLQVPVGLGSWRFDSSHPHYLAGFPHQPQDLTEGPHQADKYLG